MCPDDYLEVHNCDVDLDIWLYINTLHHGRGHVAFGVARCSILYIKMIKYILNIYLNMGNITRHLGSVSQI